ncbi:MAG: mitochondrial fission ELM1 family protein, partial [Commensalibacter sp.]|nr:mitochondrial fission ELM1 family protein [Commensalibacter sp.]
MNPEKIFSQATILTEDFAGMKSQAIGLVERAGLKYDLCHLVPKKPWSWISAPYWFSPLRAVQPFHIEANQLHVSVGSVGGAVNAALRSKDSPAIHIQNPRISINKFDLVIVNPHDRLSGDNVIVSRTALHRVTPEILFQSKIKWSAFFENFPKPLVAV